MHPVRAEIQSLLDQMKAKAAGNPELERETTEITALVMQQAVPDPIPNASRSLISTHAQAVLLRAHLRHMTWKTTGILEVAA